MGHGWGIVYILKLLSPDFSYPRLLHFSVPNLDTPNAEPQESSRYGGRCGDRDEGIHYILTPDICILTNHNCRMEVLPRRSRSTSSKKSPSFASKIFEFYPYALEFIYFVTLTVPMLVCLDSVCQLASASTDKSIKTGNAKTLNSGTGNDLLDETNMTDHQYM